MTHSHSPSSETPRTKGTAEVHPLWFDAHLSRPTNVDVTFDWVTLDGKAIAPSDYMAASGTITIPAGGVYAEFPVTAYGDTDIEPDEEFEVGAAHQRPRSALRRQTPASRTGRIWDDDGAPTLTLSGTTYAEGDSGSKELYFSAHLSHAIDTPVSFDYATADDTAAAPADYIAETGTDHHPCRPDDQPCPGVYDQRRHLRRARRALQGHRLERRWRDVRPIGRGPVRGHPGRR